MSLTALVPLPELASYPQLKEGELLKNLYRLVEKDLPVLPTYVVTQELTEALQNHNQHVHQALVTAIHDTFGDFHIRITDGITTHSNCHGDANIVQSLHKLVSTQKKFRPIMIQLTPQPDYSGTVTTNYRQSKEMLITAVAGAFDHQHEVVSVRANPRNWQLHKWHNNHFAKYYKQGVDQVTTTALPRNLKPRLDDNLALEIAQLAWQVKSYFIDHQNIEWVAIDTDVFIASAQSIETFENYRQPALATGKAATSNRSILTDVLITPSSIGKGILLVETLKYEHLRKNSHITGVITQKPVHDQSLITLLNQRNIPVLDHVQPWSALKAGTKVMIDTNRGSISRPSNLATHQPIRTSSSKVRIVPNMSPEQIKNAEAQLVRVHLNGNFVLASLDMHPNELLQTNQKNLPQTMAKMMQPLITNVHKQFMYSLSDLSSDQRHNLRFGKSHEEIEANPTMGNRGALFGLENGLLWQAEVQAVSQASKTIQPDIIIPGARTLSELLLIHKMLEQKRTSVRWIAEIKTMHMLHEIIENESTLPDMQYLINVSALHSAYLGYDATNRSLAKKYQVWPEHFKELLKKCAVTKEAQNMYWSLTKTSSRVVDASLIQHINKVIVPQADLEYVTNKLQQLDYHG